MKFRAIFQWEFEGIVATKGKCPQQLYDAMLDVATMWCPDTQEIEGTNNIVKSVGKASPNISWELMSARVMAKKDVVFVRARVVS